MKFVTITNHRTGSSFFQRCLDSHPEIIARQEDLRDIGKFPANILRGRLNEMYELGEKRVEAVGFKLMYSHVRDWVMDYIKANDVKVIHFLRRNILETAIWYPGHLKGDIEGGLGPRLKVRGKVEVKIDRVIKKLREIRENASKYAKIADFIAYYEDDLTDDGKATDKFENAKTRKKLLAFLGVEDRILKPNFYTGKSERGNAKDTIINYKELMDVIKKEGLNVVL